MPYKIELRYIYGWDDAGWADESNDELKPTRFGTKMEAQMALDEFFAIAKTAVTDGNMDNEKEPKDFRIVAVKD